MTDAEIRKIEAACKPGKDVEPLVLRARYGLVADLVRHIRDLEGVIGMLHAHNEREKLHLECNLMRSLLEAKVRKLAAQRRASVRELRQLKDGWRSGDKRERADAYKRLCALLAQLRKKV